MLAKFKSWSLRPCVFRVSHVAIRYASFRPRRTGGCCCFCFCFCFCFSIFILCHTFSNTSSSPPSIVTQILQEMRRRRVQSRLNTCTDMIPPFPVVIAWYFVWPPYKCRHAAIFFFFPFFLSFFSVADPRFSGARLSGARTIVPTPDTRHILTFSFSIVASQPNAIHHTWDIIRVTSARLPTYIRR